MFLISYLPFYNFILKLFGYKTNNKSVANDEQICDPNSSNSDVLYLDKFDYKFFELF
jgi:hypothetical protein